MTHFSSSYGTPGWQRAQRKTDRRGGFDEDAPAYEAADTGNGAGRFSSSGSAAHKGGRKRKSRLPLTIEGELVAKSTGTVSEYTIGDRVFHQKFGNGHVTAVDGNKLVVQFDRAGEKRVVDSYVQRI